LQLVVGSKARILYSDCIGRIKLAKKFNEMVASGDLKVSQDKPAAVVFV